MSMYPDEMSLNTSRLELIQFEESAKLQDYSHAGHCCIYSRTTTPLFKGYVSSALVSMQMRFDGRLGFPGGLIDQGEDVFSGVNRELDEEINLNPKFYLKTDDYLFSHKEPSRKMCFHFYAKEVSKEDFEVIEKNALKAKEYGIETMGILRVPMFTMKDGYRGFPAFLTNNFAGNAKDQLFKFLLHTNLMSSEKILAALESSRQPIY